jgi:hypothetical protein
LPPPPLRAATFFAAAIDGEIIGSEIFTGAKGEPLPEKYEDLACAAAAARMPPPPPPAANFGTPQLVAPPAGEADELRSALMREVVVFNPDEETVNIFDAILDVSLPVMTYAKSSRCRRHEAWATPAILQRFYDKVDRDLGVTTKRRGGTVAMYMGSGLWQDLEDEVDHLLEQCE